MICRKRHQYWHRSNNRSETTRASCRCGETVAVFCDGTTRRQRNDLAINEVGNNRSNSLGRYNDTHAANDHRVPAIGVPIPNWRYLQTVALERKPVCRRDAGSFDSQVDAVFVVNISDLAQNSSPRTSRPLPYGCNRSRAIFGRTRISSALGVVFVVETFEEIDIEKSPYLRLSRAPCACMPGERLSTAAVGQSGSGIGFDTFVRRLQCCLFSSRSWNSSNRLRMVSIRGEELDQPLR